MKYAFMSFSYRTAELDELISIAKKFGYAALEPRVNAKHGHGVEPTLSAPQRAEIRKKVADAGLAIACIACSAHFGDAAKAQGAIEETLQCVDLAADLGAPTVRVFADVPKSQTVEETIDIAAASLNKVAVRAAERGVVVCVETHSGFSDPDRMKRLMEKTDKPAIAVNWDVLHPLRLAGATIDSTFNAVKPWIRHVHMHDGEANPAKTVIKAIGTGDVDHRRVLAHLASISYDGYLSLEWESEESWETHLPREIATMKKYESEMR